MDPIAEGERLKEEGNVAFKAKRYGEAVDLYTKAIGEFLYFSERNYTRWYLVRVTCQLFMCQLKSRIKS